MADKVGAQPPSQMKEPTSKEMSRRDFLRHAFTASGAVVASNLPIPDLSGLVRKTEASINQKQANQLEERSWDVRSELEIAQSCQELSHLIVDCQTDEEALDKAKVKIIELLPDILKIGNTFELRISALDNYEKIDQVFELIPSALQPGEWQVRFSGNTLQLKTLFRNKVMEGDVDFNPTASSSYNISLDNLIDIVSNNEQTFLEAISTDFAVVGQEVRLVLNHRISKVRGTLASEYQNQIVPLLHRDEFIRDSFNQEGALKVYPHRSVDQNFSELSYQISQIGSPSTVVTLGALGETDYSTQVLFYFANDKNNAVLKLGGDEEGMHFEYVLQPTLLDENTSLGQNINMSSQTVVSTEAIDRQQANPVGDFYESLQVQAMNMSFLLSAYNVPSGELI